MLQSHRRAVANIRRLLVEKKLTYANIDRANGFRDNRCADAATDPDKGAEEAIAKALGKTAQELWPHRFDRDGVRLSPQPKKNFRTRSGRVQGQKRTAALT